MPARMSSSFKYRTPSWFSDVAALKSYGIADIPRIRAGGDGSVTIGLRSQSEHGRRAEARSAKADLAS
jgi:hypothetical protein